MNKHVPIQATSNLSFRDELAQRGVMNVLPGTVRLVPVLALLTGTFVAHLDDHLETLSGAYPAHSKGTHDPIFFKDLDSIAP